MSNFLCTLSYITNVRDNFRNNHSVYLSCWPKWRRWNYLFDFLVSRNYCHDRTVTSQYSMWFSRKRDILGIKLLISKLWYYFLFDRTSTFLFLDISLSLFYCIVLNITKVGEKFIKTGSIYFSCWSAWMRQAYLFNSFFFM